MSEYHCYAFMGVCPKCNRSVRFDEQGMISPHHPPKKTNGVLGLTVSQLKRVSCPMMELPKDNPQYKHLMQQIADAVKQDELATVDEEAPVPLIAKSTQETDTKTHVTPTGIESALGEGEEPIARTLNGE